METIDHYTRFPCMKPWVGDKYDSLKNKKLLLVGESHYLPKDSTIHKNAENWYVGNQKSLSEMEVKWLSTAGIINHNKGKNFPKKAHGIYRNACKVINEVTFKYEKPSDIIDHLAYYNFFQRPAEVTGKSIRVTQLDINHSLNVMDGLVSELKPDMVVFVSALAAKHAKNLLKQKNIPFVVSPHPTSAWWNRESKKYKGKGKDVIPSFIMGQVWAA